MLCVVTWKWRKEGYRSKFTALHVNTMRQMVARHYPDPHRFICITDDPEGIDPGIEVVPLWPDHGDLLNPTWPDTGPSCYRRLRSFSPEFEKIAGRRFVSLDLDVVITGDLRPLWNRPDEFIIYRSGAHDQIYNGSMYMMTTGSRRQVWDQFDPVKSPALTKAAKLRGTDQAWIQYVLGTSESTWGPEDDVYNYRVDCLKNLKGRLPQGARAVMFWGQPDPWDNAALRCSPWITPATGFQMSPDKDRALAASLALRYVGRPAVVMGGGVSLTSQLGQCPPDALYLSANQHGAMVHNADYIVALDDIEDQLRRFGVPIIGRRYWCDYRIQDWENVGDSGVTAAWLAAVMGCHPIILTGMDCYQGGTYHHDPAAFSSGLAKPFGEHLAKWQALKGLLTHAVVRSCGGPTAEIFGLWDPSEVLPEYVEPDSLLDMRLMPQQRVYTKARVWMNRHFVPPDTELVVSPKEFYKLVRHRRAVALP